MSHPFQIAPQRFVDGGGDAESEAIRRLLSQLPQDVDDVDMVRERVWRKLPNGRPAPRLRRGLLWAPAFAVLLAAGAFGLRQARPPRSAVASRIELTDGQVQTARPHQSWTDARAGDALGEGSRLLTGDGHALLSLGSTALVLEPHSDLAIESLGAQTFLRLTGGELAVRARPSAAGALVVQTTRLRVSGAVTVFSVREQAAGEVTVNVSEGAVEIWSGPERRRVRAGQAWRSVDPARVQDGGVADGDRRMLDQLAAGLHPLCFVAPDRGPIGSSVAGAMAADVPKPMEPAAPAPPAAAHVSRISRRLGERERAPVPTPSPPVDAPPAAAPSAPVPGQAEDLRLQQALELSRGGRARGAEALLEQVVEGRGAHADLALYELARLRQRELGDLPGAVSAFSQYRSAYPQGPLIQEVDLSLIDAELAQGDRAGVLRDLTRFLHEHPDSERAPEMHLLRGNLLREQGDCTGALAEYGELADGAFADDALYFSAWCQRHLGQIGAAEASLHAYLRRFPQGAHRRDAEAAAPDH